MIDPDGTAALPGDVVDARDAFAALWLAVARDADDAASPVRESGAVAPGGAVAAVRAALGARAIRVATSAGSTSGPTIRPGRACRACRARTPPTSATS